ncbi:tetratricopeptide repeat protein [Lachnospiraceae bacterium DSM 108991]|uniref:Tetratricopeptide repeat protein n=1 Tax=Claveliimonas monacensis TaxID=2779351 RepID=A0ABR9RFZ5_9FIRM|nr:tetratricopeptide repeat protein [Claveliimonas monacensis]MBE5061842.1 tetratricopeptide repeat protein [Claveliimonas monacensis]
MEREKIIKQLDALYASGDPRDLEAFLLTQLDLADQSGEWKLWITLSNELIGLYRELGKYAEALRYFQSTCQLFAEKGMEGTVPHATTLMNGANIYRTVGKPDQAAALYLETLCVLEKNLPEKDYRIAGLHNNLSLVYLEQGKQQEALPHLLRALSILEALPGTTSEQASTHTNLASLYCHVGQMRQAEKHLERGKELFEAAGGRDPHFASLLSTWADVCCARKDYDSAAVYLGQALAVIESFFGKNRSYAIVSQNLALVLDKNGHPDEASALRQEAESIFTKLQADIEKGENL